MKLPVTIWMNMPSHYQDDLFRALAARSDVDLQVIYAGGISAEREKLGWVSGDRTFAHRFLRGSFEGLFTAWRQRHRVHVVNGIWAVPRFIGALLMLMALRSRCFIYAEAPVPQRRRFWKSAARWVLGKIATVGVTGILAVGELGVRYFAGMGFRRDRIHEFGYFCASRGAVRLSSEQSAEIVFAGSLESRKALDILLEASSRLHRAGVQHSLTLLGEGEERTALKELAQRLGIAASVLFAGTIPADQIPGRLANARAVVLPSRFDAWGMVVNEAILAGTPVIASDACGAAILIRDDFGAVFPRGDVQGLVEALSRVLRGDLAKQSASAKRFGSKISPEAAAESLVRVLRGESHASLPWKMQTAVAAEAR